MSVLVNCIVVVAVIINNVDGDKHDKQNEFIDLADIDVETFIKGSNDDKFRIASIINTELNEHGMFRFINHGININLTSDLFSGSNDFFSTSNKFKMSYFRGLIGNYGYIPFGSEQNEKQWLNERNINVLLNTSDYKARIDFVESFNIFSDFTNMLSLQSGNPYLPKQNDIPPQFSLYIPGYWSQIRHLLNALHEMVSIALECDDPHIFKKNMTDGIIAIRINNYPITLNKTLNTTHIRFGIHKDFASFTFVQNDINKGLQIYHEKHKKWYQVEPKLNSILVVPGEFIEKWTNGHWISPLHRVDNKYANIHRQSIAVFTSPNMNTEIDILPCKKINATERLYPPVSAYNHILYRQKSGANKNSSQYNDTHYESNDLYQIKQATTPKHEL